MVDCWTIHNEETSQPDSSRMENTILMTKSDNMHILWVWFLQWVFEYSGHGSVIFYVYPLQKQWDCSLRITESWSQVCHLSSLCTQLTSWVQQFFCRLITGKKYLDVDYLVNLEIF